MRGGSLMQIIIKLMPVTAWIVFCVAVGIEMRRQQKALDEAYELYFGRAKGGRQ